MEQEVKDNTPDTDAFGEPTKDSPIKVEKKPDKKDDGDIEKNPLVIELRKQVADKEKMGENLSNQGKIIDTLKKEIEEMKKGKNENGEESETLHKDIKWSKDLTAEEKEELTDTEIKQMDEIAKLKETQNKLFEAINKKKEPEGEKLDVSSVVKKAAKELAEDNTDIANQIIEIFNSLDFKTEGLTEEKLKEKVKIAASQVPDYKPPKEQTGKKGNTVKGGGDDKDPFGVDKIIEEATTPKKGGYAL